MAELFVFADTDPIVRRYMNTAERARVRTWQPAGTSTLWKLELHTGHLTGDPVYIRLDGNKDKENVPKVDTLNHTADEYLTWENIANHQKLRAELTDTEQTVLQNFLVAAFSHLQLIGFRFANNKVAPADPPPPVVVQQAATRPCTATKGCKGTVPNFKGKGPCSKCFKYS